ncbi:MAG: hypothetical protein IIY78_01060 [Clostridia bacterium]|nr:hypothetical protein [Clostridia bacterium]
MRRKSIITFIGIYIALCITYGFISSKVTPQVAEAENTSQATVSVEEKTSSAFESDIDTVKSESDEKTDIDKNTNNSSNANSVVDKYNDNNSDTDMNIDKYTNNNDTDTSTDVGIDITVNIETDSETNDYNDYDEIEPEEDINIFDNNENEINADIEENTSIEYNEQLEETEQDSDEQIESEQEPEPEIPTLEEFLKNLRCSGCRHNCSLLSPRCMNGARKASQAGSEYYSMYSVN